MRKKLLYIFLSVLVVGLLISTIYYKEITDGYLNGFEDSQIVGLYVHNGTECITIDGEGHIVYSNIDGITRTGIYRLEGVPNILDASFTDDDDQHNNNRLIVIKRDHIDVINEDMTIVQYIKSGKEPTLVSWGVGE